MEMDKLGVITTFLHSIVVYNITGLTLTTFGLGVYFFVGNGVKAVSWPAMNDYANIKNGFADVAIPGLSQIPVIGNGLFSHNVPV